MPLDLGKDDTPTKFPDPEFLTLGNFKKGVITLIDKSRLPKDALQTADNLFLVEDGQPKVRPGVAWFGTQPTATVTTSAKTATAASGTNWTNPTNVYASDDSRATYAATTQDVLKITGFSAAVPTGATITGITVTVEGNGADATAANRSIDIGLTKDGSTLVGTRAASQNLTQTTDSTLTFGGDLFGTTWTVSEVNASTFGVLLRAANANAGSRAIDRVQVTISFTPAAEIDGFDYFDFDGAIHLLAAAGGVLFRSTDDGQTWTACSGAFFTAGSTVFMEQSGGFMYLTTGVDQITRYDGTTTLQTYSALTTPSAATVAATGLAGTQYTYHYKISAVNSVGFTAASPSVAQAVSLPRESWDSTSNYLTLTLPALQSNQTRTDIYISDDDLNYFYLGSSTSTTFKDDGTSIPIPSTKAPVDNTTTGPAVEELVNVGTRLYGIRDHNNRYRISFTGTGNYLGAFSNAYDGGYLDWQPGGKFIPVKVEDYRDGKGTPLATIWCKSADGQGCILQMSLDTLTVQDISITVPSAYRLPGSRGTPAPGSVVNVLNDYMFYNTQAFYNLGSRAQFLNLLSTDESSANIRPTVKQVSSLGEDQIASVYYDAKVYFSVPIGGDTNNVTIVYDTERKAWLPSAFTLGFKKFLRYTDQNGANRLLCLKPGDSKLSEIGATIKGDYGQPFTSILQTGLYATTKDRFDFQFTEEAEFEFSNPQDNITIELLGTERSHGFVPIKSKIMSVQSTLTETGHSTFAHSTKLHSDTSGSISVVSESSVKRYFTVNKELNQVQWRISTSSVNADYILRTLQTWGTPTLGGKPRSWRL